MNIDQLLPTLFPIEPADFCKWAAEKTKNQGYLNFLNSSNGTDRVGPVRNNNDGNSTILRIGTKPWLLISMQCKKPESCCAMAFLHSFSYNETFINAENLKLIMDSYLGTLRQIDNSFSSNRLLVNMVEYCGQNHTDPLKEFQPIENPHITYKLLWDYFHKNAAKVNTLLMPNRNTGNIIHHMEVLFPANYFNDKG